jgi:hypothetical protein
MKFFGKSRYAFLISQFLFGILLSGLAEARANLGKGGPDPFSCNGAEDCNRNALKELANDGFNCLDMRAPELKSSIMLMFILTVAKII